MNFGDKIGQDVLRLGNLFESLQNTYKDSNGVEDKVFQDILNAFAKHVNDFAKTHKIPLQITSVNNDEQPVNEVILNPSLEQKEEAFANTTDAIVPIHTEPLADRIAAIKAKNANNSISNDDSNKSNQEKTEETKTW